MLAQEVESHRRRFLILFAIAFLCLPAMRVMAGGVDPTFDASSLFYNNVFTSRIATQPDGKTILSGNFNRVNGLPASGLVRLNQDGSTDSTFNAPFFAGIGNSITDIVIQPDGKVVVGGTNSGPFKGLARLNTDGSVDTSFTFNAAYAQLIQVDISQDGKIVIAGDFDSPGCQLYCVARRNSDGTHDPSFAPFRQGQPIFDMALLTNGSVAVTGTIGDGFSYLRMLSSTGTLVRDMGPGIAYPLRAQPDGKLLAGSQGTLKRYDALGNIDPTFSYSGQVLEVGFTADSKIVVAGGSGTVFRLFDNGSVDPAFGGQTTLTSISDLAVALDGTVVVCGSPTVLPEPQIPRPALRLDQAGQTDISFAPTFAVITGFITGVKRIAPLPDGKTLVLGTSFSAGGQGSPIVTRLRADGLRDTSFPTYTRSSINDFALQPDGKILVGGENYLVRLNADGSGDSTFAYSTIGSGGIWCLTLQPDGKVLLFRGSPSSAKNLVRVNPDGSLDSTFTQRSLSNTLHKIWLLPNGQFFTSEPGHLYRWNSNGTIDQTFSPGFIGNALVHDIAVQPDGKIVIAGDFGGIWHQNGFYRPYLARIGPGGLDLTFNANAANPIYNLEIQNSGKFFIAGASPRLARVNANGSADPSFVPLSTTSIAVIKTQSDGKILLGGSTIDAYGITRVGVMRILRPLPTPFDFDGDGKTDYSVFRPSNKAWYVLRSQLGYSATVWGLATDKLVPADYDGDGRTDLAIYRQSTGQWSVLRSSDNSFMIAQFGTTEDIPRPADFDGDGRADLTVFRPSNGTWYRIHTSDRESVTFQFGQSGDVPLMADFDGDERADLAVYRSSNGVWYWLRSSDGGFGAAQFGIAEDEPIPGDFDGDGKSDLSVFRPSQGNWYRVESRTGTFVPIHWGLSTDKPAAGDYDGDGKADIGVWRPDNGVFYTLRTNGNQYIAYQFGATTDLPIPSVYGR